MRKQDVQYEQPVVMEKPSHHREVESLEVPGEEGYYRGIEDGKVFLVPKQNLEAMKELVNVKMVRRGESTFIRNPDPAAQKKELKRFEEKLEHLAFKMDEYEEVVLKPMEKEMYRRSTVVEDVRKKFKMSEVSGVREVSICSAQSLPIDTVETPAEKKLRGTRSLSEEITLQRSTVVGTSVKFLISGHFRNKKKPIFIIRQYRGSSVLGTRFSDFNSIKKENGFDILISGKFYRKSILEEKNQKPTTMRFKDRKKILIDSLSSILEDGFIDLFSASECDIVVGGMFVKRPTSPHYTPLVSIAVKSMRRSTSSVLGGRFSSSENRATVMSMSVPVIKSPFVQDLRKTHSVPKSGFRDRQTGSFDGRQPQGFRTLLTRIDEGEEAYECPQSPKPKIRSSSKSSTSTQNSVVQSIDRPRLSFTIPKMLSFDSFQLFKKNPAMKNEPRSKKSLSITSNTVASLNPIPTNTKLDIAKLESISFPSTSRTETISDSLVPVKLKDRENEKKSKQPKKPGFFKRIFQRLFSSKKG